MTGPACCRTDCALKCTGGPDTALVLFCFLFFFSARQWHGQLNRGRCEGGRRQAAVSDDAQTRTQAQTLKAARLKP